LKRKEEANKKCYEHGRIDKNITVKLKTHYYKGNRPTYSGNLL
jgi:hypothetical protein